MGDVADDPSRRRHEPRRASRLAWAERLVELAWRDLPLEHRLLLENIGAAQRHVVVQELGTAVHELLRSAGYPGLSDAECRALAQAAGLWIEELRLVVINANHPALRDLDEPTYDAILVRVAWHEWAHALSVVRATPEDVAAGDRLLGLAPKGVQENIRRGDYRKREYTNEVVAEIYALLMSRRRRG
jgi:hypothetical protein